VEPARARLSTAARSRLPRGYDADVSDAQQPDEPAEEVERYELTPQERERRERAIAQITQLGDPVLRTKALAIHDFDAELLSLGAHMVALMDDAIGVGLAAPQIGRPLRLFVYRHDGDGDARAIVNPVVEPITEETDVMDEGCLSIVGIQVPVERPVAVRVRGHHLDGTPIDEEVTGFSARIIQHENDHLDGVLILERTTPEARRAALKELHVARLSTTDDASAETFA
jgi:peptide deformylase